MEVNPAFVADRRTHLERPRDTAKEGSFRFSCARSQEPVSIADVSKASVGAIRCRGYDPADVQDAVQRAVVAAGGWPDKVRDARRVLLKPNLLSARSPDQAVTTHPEVVRAVIRALRTLGEKEILVGDSPGIRRSWEYLWDKTGMRKVADEEGVTLLPFESIRRVEMPDGRVLPVLHELADFDAHVTLPKLKTHLLTRITASVKNSYGLIVGDAKSSFHGEFASPRSMNHFLAECYGLLKPDFVILDAIEAMAGDGPANGYPVATGLVLAGSDGLAVDACACRMYGYLPTDIPLLVDAANLGFGVIDPAVINGCGDGWDALNGNCPMERAKADFLHRLPKPLFRVATWVMRYRPYINPVKCVHCGMCKQVCSPHAITQDAERRFKVDNRKCILCMCCLEACPRQAIAMAHLWQRLFIGMMKTHERTRS